MPWLDPRKVLSYIRLIKMLELLDDGASFLGNMIFSKLMYFSTRLSKSITDFGGVLDRYILNASHLMAYVKTETVVVVYRLKI